MLQTQGKGDIKCLKQCWRSPGRKAGVSCSFRVRFGLWWGWWICFSAVWHLPCSWLFALTPSWHMNFCVSVSNHRSGERSNPAGFLSFSLLLILGSLFSWIPQFRSQCSSRDCRDDGEAGEYLWLGCWGGKPLLAEERPDGSWQLQGELVQDCLMG